MRSRREAVSFDSKEWVWVSVQSPLGAVMLARRLPAVAHPNPAGRELVDGLSRRFDLSNHPDLATKRVRSRRSP
jgi:hypothetical protein